MSIVKNTDEIHMVKPHKIIVTKIPWIAYHKKSVVLTSSFDGHLFLKTKKGLYYLGDASGLTPPIMLENLYHKKMKPQKMMHTSEIVSIVMRRFQTSKTDIPDVQQTKYEKIARSVIWYIVIEYNLYDRWIDLEKKRVETLLEHYNLDNLKLIYPMVKSKTTALIDVEHAYVNKTVIPLQLPNMSVFQWVVDLLTG